MGPNKNPAKLEPLFRILGTRLIQGYLRSRHEWISHTGERGSQAFDPHYHLLQRSGCVRFPDRLLSETPFSALSGFSISRLAVVEVETDVPSRPLGRRWRRFSLPGWSGEESAQPIRLWRRLRRFLGGGRSLNVVCSWGASRRNQAKSGYPDSNVRLWGHSGLSGTPLRMSAYSQQRTFAGVEIWSPQRPEPTHIGHSG